MKKGIDVSVHNGYINFSSVKNAGIDFVMIRDGYGDLLSYPSQKDPRFEENYKNARAAGLAVGTYHYLYATDAAGARREAQGFLTNISGKKFDMPIALDIEESRQYNLTNATVESIITAFMKVCEKAGYYCVLYSYEAFLTAKMSAPFRSQYDVWVANTTGYAPSIHYGIWQYSFTGRVDGISDVVDMNRTERDYPKLIMAGGFNGYPKAAPKPMDSMIWYRRGDKDKNGDHGIREIKIRLQALGYSCDDTGGFGSGTEKAVKDLQGKWGFEPTGEIGEKFVKRLMK